MALVTRSRRLEVPPLSAQHQHQQHHRQHRPAIASHARGGQSIRQSSSPPRSKRPFDAIGRDFGALKHHKKTRFTVELVARRPAPSPRKPSESAASATPPPAVAPSRPATQPPPSPVKSPPALPGPQDGPRSRPAPDLDQLHPGHGDAGEQQGRKLRSQEATRFKSELSAYFPDYDEVIGNDPREAMSGLIPPPVCRSSSAASCADDWNCLLSSPDILNLDTPIVVVTSPADAWGEGRLPDGAAALHGDTVRSYGDALFGELFESQRIDFGFLEARYKGKSLDDPLSDAYFEPTHKKAERLERSIRNSEKGRAQHEKDQIIRLLDGLQGHDWLRTMGVSGITETRKKTFEPAREHFIKGCKVILEKFRLWALEEKRRKLERERALAEEAMTQGGEEDEDGDQAADEDSGGRQSESIHDEGGDASSDLPDSDADAFIAKQLRDEAMARSKVVAARVPARRQKKAPRQPDRPPPVAAWAPAEAPPEKQFTSFFSKGIPARRRS